MSDANGNIRTQTSPGREHRVPMLPKSLKVPAGSSHEKYHLSVCEFCTEFHVEHLTSDTDTLHEAQLKQLAFIAHTVIMYNAITFFLKPLCECVW